MLGGKSNASTAHHAGGGAAGTYHLRPTTHDAGGEAAGQSRVIAVANQKGGVAKTTTVHSLGAALAERGRRVLLVDLDPQAGLTYSAGIDAEQLQHSLFDVLMGQVDAGAVLWEASGCDILPAAIDLAGAEVHLVARTGREHALARSLAPVLDRYDFVILDCPPSLGILTVNGLTVATEVLIPLQPETLSHRAVGQLLETVEEVRTFTNPGLTVLGVVATMYDGRTRLARQILEQVEDTYRVSLLEPPIPRSIRVAESPGRGLSVLEHAPRSTAAQAYRQLAAVLDGEAAAPEPAI